jgi:hypothetical protein
MIFFLKKLLVSTNDFPFLSAFLALSTDFCVFLKKQLVLPSFVLGTIETIYLGHGTFKSYKSRQTLL